MSRAQLAALLVLLALRVLDGLGAFGVFRSGDEIKSSRVKVASARAPILPSSVHRLSDEPQNRQRQSLVPEHCLEHFDSSLWRC